MINILDAPFSNSSNINGVHLHTNVGYGSNSISNGNWMARGKIYLYGKKA